MQFCADLSQKFKSVEAIYTYASEGFWAPPPPPGQFPSRTIPPGQFPSRTITPGQFPPRTIATWKILPDNSHLGVLYCTRIIKTRQLLPRAMTITSYNFFMTIFCFFAMAQL